MPVREIVFDTETTGLAPDQGDRIVEIAAIELIDGVPSGRQFHAYVNPGRPVPPEVVRIHGLDDEFLKDKPFFPDVADDFLRFIGDSPLVAHNAPFDFGFVNWELSELGKGPLRNRMVCTKALGRSRFPGQPNRLDDLCDRLGVDRSQRIAQGHNALLDCQLLAQVYAKLKALPPGRRRAIGPAP